MQLDPRSQNLIRDIEHKVDSLVHFLTSRPIDPSEFGAQGLNGQDSTAQPSNGINPMVLESIARISSTLDEAALCQEIIVSAVQITGSERGFLMVMEDGKKLRFKAGFGVTQEDLTSPEWTGSRSIIKSVVKNGEPVLNSPSNDSMTSSMRRGGLQSVICCPIPIGERVQKSKSSAGVAGILYVDTKDIRNPLDQNQLDLLFMFNRHVSIALENCWLYKQR